MTARAIELNDNFMAQVNGGTFTPNPLSEKTYNSFGIKTSYHFWSKDEFWLPDGTKTDVAGANTYVKNKVGETQFYLLTLSHLSGK